MFKTIHRMQRNERGFTLVELLIVVAIIAILAAIAIPNFTRYRQKSYESTIVADSKNIAIAMEAARTNCDRYPSLTSTTGPASNVPLDPPQGCSATDMPTVNVSRGNTVSATGGTGFTITITNPNAPPGRQTHTLDNNGATNWQ